MPIDSFAVAEAQPVPATPPAVKEFEAPKNLAPVQKVVATPVQKFIEELDRTSTVPETVLTEPEAPAVEVPIVKIPIVKAEKTDIVRSVPNTIKTGNYRIQVYSLRDKAEAKQREKELVKGGFDVFLKKAVSAGQDWYIVYVGPFKDINSAKVNLKALKFSGREPILLSVTTTS